MSRLSVEGANQSCHPRRKLVAGTTIRSTTTDGLQSNSDDDHLDHASRHPSVATTRRTNPGITESQSVDTSPLTGEEEVVNLRRLVSESHLYPQKYDERNSRGLHRRISFFTDQEETDAVNSDDDEIHECIAHVVNELKIMRNQLGSLERRLRAVDGMNDDCATTDTVHNMYDTEPELQPRVLEMRLDSCIEQLESCLGFDRVSSAVSVTKLLCDKLSKVRSPSAADHSFTNWMSRNYAEGRLAREISSYSTPGSKSHSIRSATDKVDSSEEQRGGSGMNETDSSDDGEDDTGELSSSHASLPGAQLHLQRRFGAEPWAPRTQTAASVPTTPMSPMCNFSFTRALGDNRAAPPPPASRVAAGGSGGAPPTRTKRDRRRRPRRTRRSHADVSDVIRASQTPPPDASTPAGTTPPDGWRRAHSLRLRSKAREGKRAGRQRQFQTPVFSQECDNLLLEMHSWGLDHFSLETFASGRPLTALGMKIFEKTGLLTEFKISPLVLCQFFIRIEENYARYPDVPYHNNLHGTDVMHATYVLLMDPKMASSVRKIELLAALLAAAVHDVGHPGFTNHFLCETQHDFAILYNDKSVLENYHASVAFKVMSDEKCNVLASLSKDDRAAVRKMMISMILSTDMAQHFKHLAAFRSVVEHVVEGRTVPPATGETTSSGGDEGFTDTKTRVLLCAVVHLADLSLSTKPWKLCRQWCGRVMEEFFRQGDKEKELGLPVGGLHDRDTTNIPKSQMGFIDFIVLPLWETWDTLVGGESIPFEFLHENRANWEKLALEAGHDVTVANSNTDTSSSASTKETGLSSTHAPATPAAREAPTLPAASQTAPPQRPVGVPTPPSGAGSRTTHFTGRAPSSTLRSSLASARRSPLSPQSPPHSTSPLGRAPRSANTRRKTML
eukprot:m.501497 g.501497  ORF g.501497 m.501497 type:complete len:900 (+) comp21839_c0_seq5:222-2921(+)